MDEESRQLLKQNQTLIAKLAVRGCQRNIAVEGLKVIMKTNDPLDVAEKTLKCIP